ncbi:hypothetical protein [Promicromonospora sp. NPDC019610]|uniref:hypothetical protein n=1 Tax=Promicromonospora sp. NPDC019610 TaxID=3364405 RepID=UPI00379B3AE1
MFELVWRTGAVGSSADLTWRYMGAAISMHTTYVGNGLGSLVRSALDLRCGSSSAIAVLPGEPGGTYLFFQDAAREVYVQVVQFPDVWSEERWGGGDLLWSGRLPVAEYISQVVVVADSVIAQHGGADEYSKDWGGIEFPMSDVSKLRSLGPVREDDCG